MPFLTLFLASEIMKPLAEVTAPEFAETAVLECEVSHPKAEATWLKDGQPITPEELTSKKYEVVSDGRKRRLIIHDVVKDDNAEFTCKVGDNQTVANVNVKGEEIIMYMCILVRNLLYW